LIAPTNDPARVQYAQVIAREFWKIGIGANLILLSWDSLQPRLFENSGHKTYAEGGFDIGFMDWSGNPLTPGDLRRFYHSANIGSSSGRPNYYPYNRSGLDALLDQIQTEQDFDSRRTLVNQALDNIVWEYHPATAIYQTNNPYALDAAVKNFDPYRWAMGVPNLAEMYFENDTQSLFAFGSPTAFTDLNPVISNIYYDKLISQPVFSSLYEYDANLSLNPALAAASPIAIGSNDLIASYIDTGVISADSPYSAATGTTIWGENPAIDSGQYNSNVIAENKSMFLIPLKTGIPWHPGYGYKLTDFNVTADDLLWTLSYILNEEVHNPSLASHQAIWGSNSTEAIEKINETMVKVNFRGPLGNGRVADWLEALSITPVPYGGQGAIGITPDGTEILGYVDQRSYRYNTGEGTYSLIGCGPYRFNSWSDFYKRATLEKFDDWGGYGANSLWNQDAYKDNNIDVYSYTTYSSKYPAEIDLENEYVDGLDYKFQMARDISYFASKENIQVIAFEDAGMESMGYNTMHPKLSNRYVRLAISHLIDRQSLIDNLLDGLGIENDVLGLARQNLFYPTETEWQSIGLNESLNIGDLRFQGHIRYSIEKAWALMEYAGYDMTPFRVILDTTPPSVSSPADITYDVGDTGNQIIWNAFDIFPGGYNITQNEVLQENKTWTNESITISVDGLAAGTYVYRLTVWDLAGNIEYDEVTVVVTVVVTSHKGTAGVSSSEESSESAPGLGLLVIFIGLTALSIGGKRILFPRFGGKGN
jgi:ABC-type transport system substrate-binding protein